MLLLRCPLLHAPFAISEQPKYGRSRWIAVRVYMAFSISQTI